MGRHKDMGVEVDGRQLHHLRFADDIVLITPSISQAERMLTEFDETCGCIGLQLNLQRMSLGCPIHAQRNKHIRMHQLRLSGSEIEHDERPDPELGRRRRAARVAYKRIEDVVKLNKNIWNKNWATLAGDRDIWKNYWRLFKQFENQWKSRDLAISVHKKTDEWLHVLRLMSSVPNSTSDKGRMEALVNVANYHRDRQRWKSAADHYELARTLENLMVCYIHLDDFSSLELLTKQLPNGHPILSAIAEFFASAGLCEQAVQSFLRNEQVTNALHVCVQLNNWDKAVSLSRTHNLQDVNGLMGKCVGEMNESSERTLVAVQLYRRAGRFIDGARIVYRMAEEERKKTARCLRLKKLYVLAALLIEDHYRQFNVEIAEKSAADLKTTTALEKLLEEDGNLSREDARMIPRVWKAAQAYHFFMLAQRQLFQGDYFAAMTTSFSLVELETYIDPIEIYTLIETSHS
ncbi:hypothetical protein RB195_022980 [Necator americanus]|uniref:IFT121-like TPR repeats domain-containing protein n=1 Tax=Necator americanus TaxID=51031 RepID=A0ABR1EHB9_NECAM